MLSEPQPVLSPPSEEWLALKDAVRRFEHAWRQGPRPAIDDYLPTGGPLRSRVLIELVHIDLELRLKAGESARVEEYLERYPALTGDGPVTLGLIAAESELRRRRERGLSLDEYLGRFPRYCAELLEQIAWLSTADGDAPPRPAGPPVDALPEVVGYEVLELLGRGGMGVVYKARQQSLRRPVALKILPLECTQDPVWLERFRREGLTASSLNHPNIATIYDTGESAGRPFLSMELVEGQTLQALAGQRRAVGELARWFAQAARALAAAHAAGVVHRDIKPANLMVRGDGIVKVVDFGLARRLPTGGTQCPVPEDRGTDPGTLIGTPLYMSPEQVRAEAVDAATDIFSLGVALYELATGQHPFKADSEVGILHAILTEVAVPPSCLNPEVSAPLQALIERMLAKDSRFRPTAVEVEAALTQSTAQVHPAPASRRAGPQRPPMVGREHEWAALRTGFEEAAAGRGLMLCVSGEPGLGKSTLVESFLEGVAADGQPCNLARGRCSERLAGTEAYLPFLEALDSLLSGEGGAPAAQTMKLLAPTWYVQLAPLAAADPSLGRVLAEAKEASQERWKRELGVFLQEMSRQRPLVLFLDDIHWADPSSVDLLAYIGSKCPAWRLLLVLTYRPSDLLRTQHAFGPVKLELEGRGLCREVALPFLTRDDFDRYLALAFSGHQFPEELAAVLHARTEGNPLFMVDLLRYLRDRGAIVQDRGGWALVRAVPDLHDELPASVRAMIQRKVDQLSPADRQLLMAASVQGAEFDSAVVAGLLGREAADVEERLDALERVHALVRLVREQTFPDRTLTLRYGFVHVLYQNALFAALPPTRKAAWSAAAARALLGHYGEKSTALAAELAALFEAGRDRERASDYYLMAARNAARLYAHHEAVALARRGLRLVGALAETPARTSRELDLQVTLGLQLQVAQGYAAPEVGRTYARAHALCEQLEDAPPLFAVLRGLWAFNEVSCEVRKAQELAGRLLTLAQRTQDPAQLLQARQARVASALSFGDPAAAREHMEQGVALHDPRRPSIPPHSYSEEPGVACRAFGSVALWLLGYPDQAVERSREAVALGGELGHPCTLALALYFAAIVRQYRREARAVGEHTAALRAIAAEHDFPFWLASSLVFQGWAEAEQGAGASGVARLRQGITGWVATGSKTYRTYYLGLLAEALGREGQIEEGLGVLAEALAVMHRTGEGFHGAELHRLQGEFLLRRQAGEAACPEAESCFHRALMIARQQQARSLELRAAMSLARLYQRQERQAEARLTLAGCYDWFTEGFGTPDLQEARALLEQVS